MATTTAKKLQRIQRLRRLTAHVEIQEVLSWLVHEYGMTTIPKGHILSNLADCAIVDDTMLSQAVYEYNLTATQLVRVTK